MATHPTKPKLVVIVGPTASGKSELAMSVAKRFNGEIISADSRTLYSGMDIGTAKPTKKDQESIKHWGIDLIRPNQKFSAKQFKDYALKAAFDIDKRGKMPILVGGTGLYIDSVIFGYSFQPEKSRDPANPRHSSGGDADRSKKPKDTLIIGLDPGKDELAERITKRIDQMLNPAFLKEVKLLLSKYPSDLEAFKAPGYLPVMQYLRGEIDRQEVKKIFIQSHLRLAKKQRTWFKRNPHIKWFSSVKTAEQYLFERLNT